MELTDALRWIAVYLFDDELADRDIGFEEQRPLAEIDHFQGDAAMEPSMDGWRGEVNEKAKSSSGAFPFDSSRQEGLVRSGLVQVRSKAEMYDFERLAEDELIRLQEISGVWDRVLVGQRFERRHRSGLS